MTARTAPTGDNEALSPLPGEAGVPSVAAHQASGAGSGQIAATPISTGRANGAPSNPGNPLALLGGPGGLPSDKAYNIEGVTLNLDVAMQGKTGAVRGISVDGAVVFKEVFDLRHMLGGLLIVAGVAVAMSER